VCVRQWAWNAAVQKGPAPRWRSGWAVHVCCSWSSSRSVTRAGHERFSYTPQRLKMNQKREGSREASRPPKHEKRALRRRNVDVDEASTKIDKNARE
jgi:hypothetical protein